MTRAPESTADETDIAPRSGSASAMNASAHCCDRWVRLARTHEQVVAHRMALGAMHERFNRASEAINAYQDVLDQPELSSAMWEGSEIAVRAGLEASRGSVRSSSVWGSTPMTPRTHRRGANNRSWVSRPPRANSCHWRSGTHGPASARSSTSTPPVSCSERGEPPHPSTPRDQGSTPPDDSVQWVGPRTWRPSSPSVS